mmetsp:Transcript_9901/g.22722  ORF Transcript_9901/g.22722 Transcript_9901/m.22722 type:complete len:205 (-) Transcript_9901:624-1238(-)
MNLASSSISSRERRRIPPRPPALRLTPAAAAAAAMAAASRSLVSWYKVRTSGDRLMPKDSFSAVRLSSMVLSSLWWRRSRIHARLCESEAIKSPTSFSSLMTSMQRYELRSRFRRVRHTAGFPTMWVISRLGRARAGSAMPCSARRSRRSAVGVRLSMCTSVPGSKIELRISSMPLTLSVHPTKRRRSGESGSGFFGGMFPTSI